MNIKNKIMTLKETLKNMLIALSPFVHSIKLAKIKLEDGITVIEAESFEAGQSIFIVTKSGDSIAMPIGTYKLEDGTILEVKEEGIIDSITPVEAPVEAAAEGDIPVDAPTDDSVEDVVYNVTRKEFDALVSLVNEMKANLNLSNVTIEKKDAEIETLKVELSTQPAATKIRNSPDDFNSNTNSLELTAKTVQGRIWERLNNIKK